jgi:signal transduction histidine kinase/ligand-binding sensor domain-containing protein/ActR/RegA family two-component response regulator
MLWASLAFGLDPRAPARQYVVDHWNWVQGIPEEMITGFAQSPDGYLWIGHADGLIRFNGTVGVAAAWPTARAEDRGVAALAVDGAGAVWALTARGMLVRVVPVGGLSVEGVMAASGGRPAPAGRAALVALPGRMRVSGAEGIAEVENGAVGRRWIFTGGVAAAFAADGTLWMAGGAGELERWEAGGGARRMVRIPAGQPRRLHVGGQGTVWVRTADRLWSWRGGMSQEWALPGGLRGESGADAVVEDRHGVVWVGGRGSVGRLCGDRIELVRLPATFENAIVTALFEDREGALWIGTLTGDVFRLRDSPVSSQLEQGDETADAVSALYRDARGSVWMYARNRGLTRWGQGGPMHPMLTGGAVTQMGEDPATGALLAGDGESVFSLAGGRLVAIPDRAAGVLGGRTGWWVDGARRRVLVARRSGLYEQSSLQDSDGGRKLSATGGLAVVAVGPGGALWGSDRERLWALTGQEARALALPGRQAEERILTLYWDGPTGALWVGTDRGLLAWHPGRGEWSRRGLPEDRIFSLIGDGEGRLWAGTRRGIIRLEPARWLAGERDAELRLTHADGLRTLNFGMSQGQSGAALAEGRILFASLEGAVAIDPRQIAAPTFGPTPLIASLTAAGQAVPLAGLAKLPTGVSQIEIAFDAFSVSSPRPVSVEYWLEGIDPGWQPAGTRRSIQYSNLAPGDYRFRLRSSWAGGAGLRETSLSWSIPPRIYQTSWFGALSGLFVISLTALRMRHRTRQTALRTAELEAHVAERTRELEAAKAAAESAAAVKSDFLATMSHELRTPMNGVLGLAELLAGTRLDEAQQEMLTTLRTSGESLLEVVNDILDLSKIDSGRLQIEKIPTNLPRLMADLFQVVKPMADKKRLALTLSSRGNVVHWIEGDPARIRQILLNLLSNAIKFTPAGWVELRVDWQETAVMLAVADSGIGIPADKVPQLFENFVQVDSSTTRLYGGTGLGLAICRRLAEAMGGTIDCTSTPGQGSTFTVTLPLLPVAAPAEEADLPEERPAVGIRVLVAEDNRTNQKVVLGLLKKLGIEAAVAQNGQEAVEACERECFDLVLMDCQMPVLDGYSATRQILEKLGPAAPPIVALTAHAMESDRVKCLAAGMRGHMTKPVLLEQLREAVREHCQSAASR